MLYISVLVIGPLIQGTFIIYDIKTPFTVLGQK